MTDVKARVAALRHRYPWLDHAVRSFGRYSADTGDRLAAGVTYFGFLSVFPLIALAFSVLGYVLAGDTQAQADFTRSLQANFPGLIGGKTGINVDQIVRAKAGAGILGLVGLLFAGLGWIDALRTAIRSIWHQNVLSGNFVVKKIRDIGVLAALGLALGISLVVTALVSGATSFVLRHLGVDETLAAKILVRAVGVAVVLATDTVLFVYLFTGLPRLHQPWRRVLRGAVLAAVLFEIVKLVGSFYIKRTTHNPVYGTVAVAVGLLIWINLVSRIMLFCAAWTVTAAGDSDVAPSGTSSPEAARRAGLPKRFGAHDADSPPALLEEGAPGPLRAAVEGQAGDLPQPAPAGSITSRDEPPAGTDGSGRGPRLAGALLAVWWRRRRKSRSV